MNIWNKVLIGLICFLGIFAILWSAKVLNHYVKQGADIKKMEDDTALAIKAIETARDYDKGIPTLELRNIALLANRTENWQFCKPESVERLENEHVQVIFSLKPETVVTMKAGDVIYVFDQRAFGNGGKYLGRFEVTQAHDRDITANSLDAMTDREYNNLETSRRDSLQATQTAQKQTADEQLTEENAVEDDAAESQAAWSVFSRCPTDRPDLFMGLDDADKVKYLPDSIYKLYANYDPEAKYNPNVPYELQESGKFFPRDFGPLFAYYYKKRIENSALLAEKLTQKDEIDKSNKIASDALTFCQNQNVQLGNETKLMESQREEVDALCKALDVICNQHKDKIKKTQQDNERMVEEIRKFQREMLQKSGRTARETVDVTVR